MTIEEINQLAADRRTVRELLSHWKRARWQPLEADQISTQIAAVVERPLSTLAPGECPSGIWVAPVMTEALSYFASEQTAWTRPLDWPIAVQCYDLDRMHPEYRKRLNALLLPMELVLTEDAA